jgi:hypothetical protein
MNERLETIETKLETIETKLETIETKLETILNILNNVQKDCSKMNEHIDFVDTIYNIVKSPLGFLINIKTPDKNILLK